MASKIREKIRMVSTGKTEDGKNTGTFYTTTKNKRNAAQKGTEKSGKISLKKFDKRAFNKATGKCGMHVLFKEGKIK